MVAIPSLDNHVGRLEGVVKDLVTRSVHVKARGKGRCREMRLKKKMVVVIVTCMLIHRVTLHTIQHG